MLNLRYERFPAAPVELTAYLVKADRTLEPVQNRTVTFDPAILTPEELRWAVSDLQEFAGLIAISGLDMHSMMEIENRRVSLDGLAYQVSLLADEYTSDADTFYPAGLSLA